MRAFFHRLYRLGGKEEDFFTELFAQLLRIEPERQVAFLRRFIPSLQEVADLQAGPVDTQCHYEARPDHDSASRIDMRLRPYLAHGCRAEVLIEAKIGSSEGREQLRRYADHLAATTDLEKRVILYITRDYEPKPEIAEYIQNACGGQFHTIRWYSVYQFLQDSLTPTWLSTEISQFMKEHKMTQNLKFSPVEALAMTHFRQAEAMMWQTLDGEVAEKLRIVSGASTRMKQGTVREQYQNHGRYMVYQTFSGFLIGAGYRLAPEAPTEYPLVGLILEANYGSRKKEHADELKRIQAADSHNWQGFDLDDTTKWPRIWRSRPLSDFLSGEDHVHNVQQYLLECLEVVEKLKPSYPNLPWSLPKVS